MSNDKGLITDIVKEVGNQAMSLTSCQPFVTWVLENTPIVLEHDCAAVVISDPSEAKLYLRLNQPLSDGYIQEFKLKTIEALGASMNRKFSEKDIEVVICSHADASPLKGSEEEKVEAFYHTNLIVRGKNLGLFAISSRKPDTFLVYRINMFKIFADQVALAIDSLKAREEVVRQARIIEIERVKMQTAFCGMAEGLVMLDESNQIVLINPVARKMLGVEEDHSGNILGVSLAPVFISLSEQVIAENRLVSREINLGKSIEMVVRLDAAPAIDAQNKRLGIVVLLRDITKDKEIDRLKSEFISTVSHELRTPLTTIRESVSQVLDGILGPVTEQQTEFLSFCLEDVDRLTRLINDLLDISRLEAKKADLHKEVLEIVGLVKGVHASFISRVAAKGLEIRTNFSKEKIQVYADRDKLVQVFTNLVGNSLKFTEHGFIEISVTEKADVIVCSVRDTGKGISEADVPKTFSKFQQFGRTDDAGEKGTGLGLSISKGIVELHGGKIWVESKLNEGSLFSFILPAQIPG
jgi:signal transduction histidine kinase